MQFLDILESGRPGYIESQLEWVRRKTRGEKNPKNLTSDWSNGITLCTLIDAIEPGSCPRCDLLHPDEAVENVNKSLRALKNVLKMDPFIETDKVVRGESAPPLSYLLSRLKIISAKRNLRRALKKPLIRVTDEKGRSKSVNVTSECFAKGMGLQLAVVGRRARFNIFFQNASRLNLVVEIMGPNDSKGSQTILEELTALWRYSTANQSEQSATIGDDEMKNKIAIMCEIISSQKVSISYVPVQTGKHRLSVLWDDMHITGSPFTVQVDSSFQNHSSCQSSSCQSPSCQSSSCLHSPPSELESPLLRFPSSRKIPLKTRILEKTLIDQVLVINGIERPFPTPGFVNLEQSPLSERLSKPVKKSKSGQERTEDTREEAEDTAKEKPRSEPAEDIDVSFDHSSTGPVFGHSSTDPVSDHPSTGPVFGHSSTDPVSDHPSTGSVFDQEIICNYALTMNYSTMFADVVTTSGDYSLSELLDGTIDHEAVNIAFEQLVSETGFYEKEPKPSTAPKVSSNLLKPSDTVKQPFKVIKRSFEEPRTRDRPEPRTRDRPEPRTRGQPEPRTRDQPEPGTTQIPDVVKTSISVKDRLKFWESLSNVNDEKKPQVGKASRPTKPKKVEQAVTNGTPTTTPDSETDSGIVAIKTKMVPSKQSLSANDQLPVRMRRSGSFPVAVPRSEVQDCSMSESNLQQQTNNTDLLSDSRPASGFIDDDYDGCVFSGNVTTLNESRRSSRDVSRIDVLNSALRAFGSGLHYATVGLKSNFTVSIWIVKLAFNFFSRLIPRMDRMATFR